MLKTNDVWVTQVPLNVQRTNAHRQYLLDGHRPRHRNGVTTDTGFGVDAYHGVAGCSA